MCILFVRMLLKLVSCYDFSVLSMSVIGFQQKIGVSSLIQFFGIFGRGRFIVSCQKSHKLPKCRISVKV